MWGPSGYLTVQGLGSPVLLYDSAERALEGLEGLPSKSSRRLGGFAVT